MPRPRLLLTALTSLALVAAATGLLRHYHIGVSNDGEVAEWAAATGRGPEECLRIIPIDIFPRPTAEQIRNRCVRRYAELTHDPTACELLLPGDYGASCLGVAREKGDGCDINYAREVMWSGEPPSAAPSRATLEECRQGREASPQGAACCHILRVTSEPGFDDCSIFEPGGDMAELCYKQLAVKLDRPDLCDRIASENRRAICRLTVKYF